MPGPVRVLVPGAEPWAGAGYCGCPVFCLLHCFHSLGNETVIYLFIYLFIVFLLSLKYVFSSISMGGDVFLE